MHKLVASFFSASLLAVTHATSWADTAWFQRGDLGLEYKALQQCGSINACRTVAGQDGAIVAEPSDGATSQWLAAQFGTYTFWLGFSDSASEGTFIGFSGLAPAEVAWCDGEPAGRRAENYVALNQCATGRWSDVGKTGAEHAVIQRRILAPAPVTVSVYKNFQETRRGLRYGSLRQSFRASAIDTGIRGGFGQWWPLGDFGEAFASEFIAVIEVAADGNYKFTVGGDDAIYFFINDTLVLSQPGNHGYFESSRRVPLSAGKYTVRVQHANLECCESGVSLQLPTGVQYVN